MPGVHVGGCHPKANTVRRRGFPIAEKRREGKRSMIGYEMMDRRPQGFFRKYHSYAASSSCKGMPEEFAMVARPKFVASATSTANRAGRIASSLSGSGLTTTCQVGQIRREVGPTIDLHQHFW